MLRSASLSTSCLLPLIHYNLKGDLHIFTAMLIMTCCLYGFCRKTNKITHFTLPGRQRRAGIRRRERREGSRRHKRKGRPSWVSWNPRCPSEFEELLVCLCGFGLKFLMHVSNIRVSFRSCVHSFPASWSHFS